MLPYGSPAAGLEGYAEYAAYGKADVAPEAAAAVTGAAGAGAGAAGAGAGAAGAGAGAAGGGTIGSARSMPAPTLPLDTGRLGGLRLEARLRAVCGREAILG